MPRRMTEIEKKRALAVFEMIVASCPTRCDMAYVPDVIRAVTSELPITREQCIQGIRDALSLGLVEMHFDQSLRPIPKSDEHYAFPAPGAGKVNRAPWKQAHVRLAVRKDATLCDADRVGAGAKDFPQPELFLSGSFERKDGKTRFSVDLSSYDIIAINTSGGKDSQAMVDAVFRECRRQGLVDRIRLYHADLERIEWPGTADLAELQARYYDLPFVKKARPQGDLLEHVWQHGEWPGTQQRYCTSDMKRGQINTLFTKHVDEISKERAPGASKRPVRILNCLGVRAEESPARSKSEPFRAAHPDYGTSGKRVVDKWYPIFHWSARDVWETIARSGVPHHWAYDVGMPRLSCVFCVMGNKDALLLGGIYNPGLLEAYADMEEKLRDLPREMQRTSKVGTRAWRFTDKTPISAVLDAMNRGESPSDNIEINSFL